MKYYLFKALGEDTKLSILKALSKKNYCACKLPKKIKKTQSNTSMHLTKLCKWGMVGYKKDGKKKIYSITDNRVKKALKLIKEVKK